MSKCVLTTSERTLKFDIQIRGRNTSKKKRCFFVYHSDTPVSSRIAIMHTNSHKTEASDMISSAMEKLRCDSAALSYRL